MLVRLQLLCRAYSGLQEGLLLLLLLPQLLHRTGQGLLLELQLMLLRRASRGLTEGCSCAEAGEVGWSACCCSAWCSS